MIINFISSAAFPQSSLFVPLTRLESNNGLSSPNIRAIIQDKYGFMWFGTQEGLSRYDGYKFINYNADAQDKKHYIISNDVYDLAIDSSGDYLWAITTYGGLSKIDIKTTNTLQLFPLNSISKKSNSLWFIKICFADKYIFIATNEGIVAKFNTVTDSVEAVL
ncbi:MAG: two-component regulator propeller domain-containing protein, partial [Panacibacter sp.]